MTRTGDVRARMVEAGECLFSRNGYASVTLLDVMHKAGTPRGSIYYHFPNGKEELAIEIMAKVASDLEKEVASLGDKHESAVDFLQAVVDFHARGVRVSKFEEGCPVAATLTNGPSEPIRTAVNDTFTRWANALAAVLTDKGIKPAPSGDIALDVVSGIEGAMIVSRAIQSMKPMKQFRALIPAILAR